MSEQIFETLEEMGMEVDDTLRRMNGSSERCIKYLQQFANSENIHLLEKAVDDKNAEAAEREAHSLKGMALTLGMLPLVDAIMDMLMAFREGKREEAFTYYSEIKASFERFADVILKMQEEI